MPVVKEGIYNITIYLLSSTSPGNIQASSVHTSSDRDLYLTKLFFPSLHTSGE